MPGQNFGGIWSANNQKECTLYNFKSADAEVSRQSERRIIVAHRAGESRPQSPFARSMRRDCARRRRRRNGRACAREFVRNFVPIRHHLRRREEFGQPECVHGLDATQSLRELPDMMSPKFSDFFEPLILVPIYTIEFTQSP